MLHDLINIMENQDDTLGCELHKDESELVKPFPEEYMSPERFEAINTIKTVDSDTDLVITVPQCQYHYR